jgi:hypothetical protein
VRPRTFLFWRLVDGRSGARSSFPVLAEQPTNAQRSRPASISCTYLYENQSIRRYIHFVPLIGEDPLVRSPIDINRDQGVRRKRRALFAESTSLYDLLRGQPFKVGGERDPDGDLEQLDDQLGFVHG